MRSTLAGNFPWSAGLARWVWPEGAVRRKRWVVAAGVLLGLVALHTTWTLVATSRLDRVTERVGERWGSMALASLAPPGVEDRDNAARAVRAASELLQLPEPVVGRRIAVRSFGSFEAKAPSPDELESVRDSVAANALTLRVLDEAVARPAANWGLRYAAGVSTPIPDLLRIVNLSKLNAAAGRLALREGRTADLLRAVERGAALERSLADEPMTIIQVVGASAQRHAIALLREWLVDGEPDPDSLARLAGLWADRPRGEPLEAALATEAKAMVAVMLDATVADAPEAGNSAIVAVLARLFRPVVIDNVRAYLERMERVVDCATRPRPQRDPSCADRRDEGAFGRYHFLARTMVLDFAGTFERVDVAESRAALAGVAIALERYRLRHEGYPESLASLAPEWLASVPPDPWTGDPFRYERQAAGYRLTSAAESDESRSASPPHDPVLSWVVER